MNEYKTLIAILRNDEFCESLGYKHCFYIGNAADAIERLVEERNSAIADLKTISDFCSHRERRKENNI